MQRFQQKALLKGSFGEVAEWSIAAVLKTVVPRGTRGSNPCLSAKVVPLQRFQQKALLKGSFGEVAEWSIAAVLKTVVPRGTRGSNPCLSAGKNCKTKKIPVN